MNIIHFTELVFLLGIYRVEKTIQNAYTNTHPPCTYWCHSTPPFGIWIISLDRCLVGGTPSSNLD